MTLDERIFVQEESSHVSLENGICGLLFDHGLNYLLGFFKKITDLDGYK